MSQEIIYLDNNATTRTDHRVLEVMLPIFTQNYANASSSHLFGLTVKEEVENALQHVAELINANPKEIIFTSGATEAINLAIKGLEYSNKKHIVTVSTEHKAVLESCEYMESRGFKITYLAVQNDGLIDLNLLKNKVTNDTLLVIVMLANNETGVLQPIEQIAEIAYANGSLFMCDATQAVGKIPVDVRKSGIDILTFSAHKFYGPKGVGALYISKDAKIRLNPQIHGGGHQRKIRSGTLNVPGIVGLGKACEIAKTEMSFDAKRLEQLRNHLENELLKIEGSYINGSQENRLYTTSNICFPGINSEKLILALQHISVSNGSACTAAITEPSFVLKAIGLSDADALASVRFSVGRFTTAEEIEITIKKITALVRSHRSLLQ